MQPVTINKVLTSWGINAREHAAVRDFLLSHAAPILSHKSGRGVLHFFSESVLSMKDDYIRSRPVKQRLDMAALSVRGRAAKAAKRKTLEEVVRAMDRRLQILEKLILQQSEQVQSLTRNNGDWARA